MNRSSTLFALALVVGAAGAAQAAGDPVAGEKVFHACQQCHKIGPNGSNFYGPSLNGVVNRKAGTVPGYEYSEANEKSGIVWTEDALRVYVRQPREKLPGSDMTFKGLKDPQEIEDLIAYLKQFGRDGKMIDAK